MPFLTETQILNMIVEISSFSNPRIKSLKALSKSRNRKTEGVFCMEGRPELDHAFNAGLKPKLIAFCEHYISLDQIMAITSLAETEVLNLSKAVFDDLTYQNVPKNFLAVFESWQCHLSDFDPRKLTIVLENLEKPGNLGAVIRTCDALGIKQVLVSNSEIDLFNPNVLRNSRGGIFNVDVVFTSNQEASEYLNQNKVKSLAAVLSPTAKDFKSINNQEIEALIFGAESTGLSSFWLDQEIQHIIIPMNGVVDSLNLSVSVAILASHFNA
jgi:RNA methyltransferase, TrmH family